MVEKSGPGPGPDLYTVVRTTGVVAATAALGLLAWQLSHVLLLIFGSVLFAIILSSIAQLFSHHTPIHHPWSVLLSGLVLLALAASFFILLGVQIQSQVANLLERLPQDLATLGRQLGIENLEQRLLERAEDYASDGLASKIMGYTSTLLGALASLALVLIAGIYLAVNPDIYRRGLLALFPKRSTAAIQETVANCGRALQLWLLGQLISMLLIGTLTTIGFYLLGLESALALGFIAGIGAFVPIVGPFLAFIPALLVAASQNAGMVLWVSLVYLVVQQVESYLIIPVVQREAVKLPPVLTLFSVLAFGVLFGPLGVILATPATVLVYVVVKQLYVRNLLEKNTEVPGEKT